MVIGLDSELGYLRGDSRYKTLPQPEWRTKVTLLRMGRVRLLEQPYGQLSEYQKGWEMLNRLGC